MSPQNTAEVVALLRAVLTTTWGSHTSTPSSILGHFAQAVGPHCKSWNVSNTQLQIQSCLMSAKHVDVSKQHYSPYSFFWGCRNLRKTPILLSFFILYFCPPMILISYMWWYFHMYPKSSLSLSELFTFWFIFTSPVKDLNTKNTIGVRWRKWRH